MCIRDRVSIPVRHNAEICEAQNPKRNAERIARRRSIHPSYGYLV